jgi:hypothetical protein
MLAVARGGAATSTSENRRARTPRRDRPAAAQRGVQPRDGDPRAPARSASRRGRYHLELAEKVRPGDADARANLGVAYYKTGDLARATSHRFRSAPRALPRIAPITVRTSSSCSRSAV